jgi:hypothetical protein
MEGWVTLQNSRKYHYVVDKMTLCKKFMYLGDAYDGEWTGKFTDDDCAGCIKQLQRRDTVKENSSE